MGSLLCFPEILPRLPVLQANPNELNLVTCDQVKVNVSITVNRSAITFFYVCCNAQDHIVALVMKSAKREATSVGRCVAISSLALYTYCQLSHGTGHSKIKEAIAVLVAVLKVSYLFGA